MVSKEEQEGRKNGEKEGGRKRRRQGRREGGREMEGGRGREKCSRRLPKPQPHFQ